MALIGDIDQGFDFPLSCAIFAIRLLPWPPFNSRRFQTKAWKHVEGVDFPAPEMR